MNAIGIVQGRLSPPVDGRIQAFPCKTWREEFEKARVVGFDCIEWIYELQGAADNPIATAEGIAEMRGLAARTGVSVRSLCADALMDCPVVRVDEAEARRSSDMVWWLLEQSRRAGIQRLVLPFVGPNAIDPQTGLEAIAPRIQHWAGAAERLGVEIHLETALDPAASARLLAAVSHPTVKITYDIGNSLQFGFVAAEELAAYGPDIGSVHVKDSTRRGPTARLGTGDADFSYCFGVLASLGYRGDYVIQGARVDGLDEIELAREYYSFVRARLERLRN
jgi:hexulose-6-phosphate isomerase